MSDLVGMDFGGALALLKAGKRVKRLGWNGKGMWIARTAGTPVPETGGLDDRLWTMPFIYMKSADGTLVPWLASQTDLLSEDWELA